MVFGGGIHPYDLTKNVPGILKGFDGDLSVGVSWTKLAKGMGKAGREAKRWKELKESVEKARDAAQALKQARKKGTIEEATKIAAEHADTFKKLIREGAADGIAEVAVKSTASGAQAKGSGVNIPYGKGLQAGVWRLDWVSAELLELNGCKNCDPSKSTGGSR